ncbi:hypothetical protein DBR36_16360 [Microbacterium sp. HMWF026]|nr:hypothetical protein DBR36_16360 [Microbacterium sp. HMWF026]
MRRARRRLSVWATAATVAVVLMPLAPSSANAAGNDAQWWADTYGVDATHTAGLTGAGVKVAVIDNQMNPNLPVFAGRNLSISETRVCTTGSEPVTDVADPASIHGTTMVAMLIGNGTGAGEVRGIAPDAEVTFYGLGPEDAPTCAQPTDDRLTPFGTLIKAAVDDGAQVISMSYGTAAQEQDAPVVAYALARGVAVVISEPNASEIADPATDIASMNGIVGVSQVNRDGELQEKLDGGPFVVPETTVVAAGHNLPNVGANGDWSQTKNAAGSSFATPIVAGMLALAAQKYPQATGNQLVHALISSTNGTVHEPVRADDGYGYGAAWLPTLLTVDPEQYPDETPLMGRELGMPSAEQVSQARAEGFVAPESQNEPRNTFDRGAVQQAPFDLTPLVVGGVGLLVVLVLVAGIITVLVITRQRRKTREGTTP